ncbi:MAG: MBL fold metallo-hydrolase [Candidatus Thorarchaeota archaeon]|nr:MBL fold metallo-hydrolase [Candidatus Thorarchaeota archaeon]
MNSKIILLGTGNPNPDPDRFGPSVAITVNESLYLIDCGAGVVRRVAAAGIPVSKITRVFLTHLHSDHTIGYPDVILTPGVVDRNEPLEVYGPTGLVDMTEHIMAAYKLDIQERFEGLEPANQEGYVVLPREIGEGIIYSDNNVQVEAFRVNHGSLESYGYKFILPDRKVVISGDTCLSENLIKHAGGCDVLIHEVYSSEGLKRRTNEWIKYHSSVHTSTRELAEIATKVKPKLLIMYHQLFMKRSENELLQEIIEHYDGKVVSGNDLDVF